MKSRSGVLVMAAATCVLLSRAQEDTRGIVPEDLVRARPKAHTSTARAPKYQPLESTKSDGLPQLAAGRELGVTIWRLRMAGPGDGGARILVHEDKNTISWIPERVASTSNLNTGDRVRLSVESRDPGYLYVIDRERYSSGEYGTPYLIFPTARIGKGDNKVFGGKLIDIPSQEDQPNFFTLQKGRTDQIAEELTLLLAPQPLEGLAIGSKPLELTEEQVGRWESQWGKTKIRSFELSGGAGRAWTEAEQRAASNATRLLTQEDPPPQTVYRASAGPNEALMVTVRLRYRLLQR